MWGEDGTAQRTAAAVKAVRSTVRETKTHRLILWLFVTAARRAKGCYQLPGDVVHTVLTFVHRRVVPVEMHLRVACGARPCVRSIVLPNAVKTRVRVALLCFGDDDRTLAHAAGIQAVDVYQWAAERRAGSRLRRQLRESDVLVVADRQVRKVPRLVGAPLCRAGRFPAAFGGQSDAERLASLTLLIKKLHRTVRYAPRTGEKLTVAFTVGHTDMREEELAENVNAAIDKFSTIVGASPSTWVKRAALKAGFHPSVALKGAGLPVPWGAGQRRSKLSARKAAINAFAEGLLSAVLASDVTRLCRDHDLVPSEHPWTGRAPRYQAARELLLSRARYRRERVLQLVLASKYVDPYRPDAARKTPFQFALRYSDAPTVRWLVSRSLYGRVDGSVLAATVRSNRSLSEKEDLLRCFLANAGTVENGVYDTIFAMRAESGAGVHSSLLALLDEHRRKGAAADVGDDEGLAVAASPHGAEGEGVPMQGETQCSQPESSREGSEQGLAVVVAAAGQGAE